MESVSLYSEARNEYMKQMSTWIVPQLVEFFRHEYDRIGATEGKRVMSAFQNWCAEVPRWNQDVIDANVNELLDNCKCDYIEDLMTAIFIAHTKMLTAIRVNTRQKKLQITLPKLDHFLHRVFVECARAFWKAPFLFSDDVSPIDRQKNVLQAEAMCVEALGGAVRSLLPVKNILRDNLEDEEEEPVQKQKHKHKRRKYESSSESDSSSEEDAPAPVLAPGPVPAPVLAPVQAPVHVVVQETPVTDEPTVGGELIEDFVDPNPVFTVAEPQSVPFPEVPAPVTAPAAPAPVAPSKPLTVTKEPAPVQLIKDETVAKIEDHVVIDTEPSVKFSPYEMVYDETTPNISEMRYSPKMSIEEMPDKPPYEPIYAEDDDLPPARIHIGSNDTPLSGSDIEVVDVGGDSPMELNADDFESL